MVDSETSSGTRPWHTASHQFGLAPQSFCFLPFLFAGLRTVSLLDLSGSQATHCTFYQSSSVSLLVPSSLFALPGADSWTYWGQFRCRPFNGDLRHNVYTKILFPSSSFSCSFNLVCYVRWTYRLRLSSRAVVFTLCFQPSELSNYFLFLFNVPFIFDLFSDG